MSTSGIGSTSGTSSTGLITPVTIEESGGLSSGSTLTNTGSGGTPQIVGLASGINTTELIQAELAEQEEPLENIQAEISGLTTEDNTLSTIQTSLQTVSLDAELMGEPSLFFPTQSIASSNSDLVTAATTNGVGAPIGSNTITVTALASAATTTLDYTTPQAADTLSFQVGSGTTQTVNIKAGETAEQLAATINGNTSLGIYATYQTTDSGQQQLVLSAAATGTGNVIVGGGSGGAWDTAGGITTATNAGGAAEQYDGTDATYYLNGTEGTSATDTVTNAIPGVTLTLLGITGSDSTDNPVTLTTGAPGPNTQAIVQQVQQFVNDYNTAMSALQTDVNTAPASENSPSSYNPYSGSLFGDDQLEELMADMRTSIYQTYGSGSTGPNLLSQIGISTDGGQYTGTVSASSETGQLSLNTTTLTQEIESNPNGVQALLQSWSSSFQSVVNAQSSPGGAIAERISGNQDLITQFNSNLTSQEALFNQEEANMEEQWAQVESTLEDLDDQKTSL
ncbi:MAG TPA: flagellar filament capping protein FliD, partial [Solirubrobacteraceae bacterium]|nr:flagellar filament capping protein FliD [Solirubrobacteraceae bacterium]